ncbi:MAG: hypothetical protein ABI172_08650 [Ginsengibacter sp.]
MPESTSSMAILLFLLVWLFNSAAVNGIFVLLFSALLHLASKRCRLSESKLQQRTFAVSWHGKIPKFFGRAIGFSSN